MLRDGWKIETVARRFGVHHSVVRRMIRVGAPLDGRRATKGSALDPHREYLVRRLGEHPELGGAGLFLELRERGYSGGINMVRRHVAKVRAPRQRKAYLRIETEPGEQAQVDWGSFGQVRIGATQRPLSAFAMVPSWSRMLFIDFAFATGSSRATPTTMGTSTGSNVPRFRDGRMLASLGAEGEATTGYCPDGLVTFL